MCDEIRKQWLDAIISINRKKANEIMENWIEDNGSERVFTDILRPALEEIGQIWSEHKDITFAQVYVATTIAEDAIIKVHEKGQDMIKTNGSKVILGNSEDDYHSLGRRLVETSMKAAGWNVIDLGVDVLAEDFVDSAISEGAEVIMISAMLYSTALNIRKVRDEINKRGYQGKIKLIVGGAVFSVKENLWKEVGADAFGRSALDAGKLAEEVLNRPFFET